MADDPKFVEATELKRGTGRILDGIRRGSCYFVRRRGELIAAILPWADAPAQYLRDPAGFIRALAGDTAGVPRFIEATELKRSTGEFLDAVRRGECIFVRRNGVLVAAMLPWADAPARYLRNPAGFMISLARDANQRTRLRQRLHESALDTSSGAARTG